MLTLACINIVTDGGGAYNGLLWRLSYCFDSDVSVLLARREILEKVKADGEGSQVIEYVHPSQQMDFCTFACFQQTVSE